VPWHPSNSSAAPGQLGPAPPNHGHPRPMQAGGAPPPHQGDPRFMSPQRQYSGGPGPNRPPQQRNVHPQYQGQAF
jgi:CCR4-NOT transcriptional complex subunit CAF120